MHLHPKYIPYASNLDSKDLAVSTMESTTTGSPSTTPPRGHWQRWAITRHSKASVLALIYQKQEKLVDVESVFVRVLVDVSPGAVFMVRFGWLGEQEE